MGIWKFFSRFGNNALKIFGNFLKIDFFFPIFIGFYLPRNIKTSVDDIVQNNLEFEATKKKSTKYQPKLKLRVSQNFHKANCKLGNGRLKSTF